MAEKSLDSKPVVLEIDRLTVGYRGEGGWHRAVRDVSIGLRAGETYGLVGESGSGKTTLALAVMGYLPRRGAVLDGTVRFDGRELVRLTRKEMRRLWGSEMAMVPQDPLSSLNPSMRIGEQIAEGLRHRQALGRAAAEQRTLELLDMVRIADRRRVAAAYPHQISGGMQQRVLIAMALSTEPKLLILDEPTTSLDATTQATILDLVRDLMQEHRAAVLYVTHNLGVVARICRRVGVLYAGELVEEAPTRALYRQPLFPYTRGLWDSVPRLGESKTRVRLRAIQGRIPSAGELPTGCIFRARCPIAIDVCSTHPPLYAPSPGRSTRCHRWGDIAAGRVDPRQRLEAQGPPVAAEGETVAVLAAQSVAVHFKQLRTTSDVLKRRPGRRLRAVDGIDLSVPRGRTVGLVGESGSGKTTLARAIVGLTPRTGGEIRLLGKPLPARLNDRAPQTLRHLQMVFQDPQEALNPYLTIGQTLGGPLLRLSGLGRRQVASEVERLLQAVGLPASYRHRFPGQMSGGEKQRVAVARAFATHPDLLVADEPVTSLDVSVQASMLNLLHELQVQQETAYLFISHNLAVVGYLADEVAVIYLGRLMEVGPSSAIFDPPYHPYTEALLSAIPLVDPDAEQVQIRLEGEVPSPVNVPGGCPFHTRCPRKIGRICEAQTPPWRTTRSGKQYFCHIPPEDLESDQTRAFVFHAGEDRRA